MEVKIRKCLLFFCAIVSQVNYSLGQSDGYQGTFVQKESTIELGAVSDNEAIYFRWAPETKEELDAIQKHGVKITKIWDEDQKQKMQVDTLYFLRDTKNVELSDDQSILSNTLELYESLKQQRKINDPVEAFSAQRNVFYSKLFLADISLESAEYQILGYVDREVKPKTTYNYTFKFLAPNLEKERYRLIMNLGRKFEFPKINDWEVEGGDRIARLQWRIDLERETYAAYYIEKSTNGKDFKPLNQGLPFRPMNSITNTEKNQLSYFTDSLEANRIPHYYRVQGVNFFGQLGPYSEMIKIEGMEPPVSSKPTIVGVQEIDKSYMDIAWYFNPDFESRIQYFQIERATNIEGPYNVISSKILPSQRSFLDESPLEIQYYKVTAKDENDHLISSPVSLTQRNDMTAPAKPTNLIGSVDSFGIVNLSWDANTESDLDGYHVFYCNTKNGEYSILTNSSDINDTYYRDSIATNTLGKAIFYKILAIDFQGNQSLFSDPLEIRRPDKYPPVPAVFKLKRNQQNQVYMSWGNSSSSDVVNNMLQRSLDGQSWQTIYSNEQIGGLSEYVDMDIDCSSPVFYRIKSVDDSGLTSFSDRIQLQCIANGQLSDLIDLQIAQEKKSFLLSWSNPYRMTPSSIIVYRSTDDSEPQKIKQFWPKDINENEDFEFIDSSVQLKKRYQYYVVLRYSNRQFSKSDLSKKLKLKKSKI